MQVIPLAAVANQSFTATLDGVRWGLAIKEARGAMCVDVARDGVQLLAGARILAGEALIPYAYLQTANFVLLTNAGELPAWRRFGVSQTLVYLSAADAATVQASPPTAGELAPFVPSYLLDQNGFYLTTDTGDLLTDD